MSDADGALAGTEAPGGVDYGQFTFRVKPHVLQGLAAAAATAVPGSAAVAALTCYRLRVGDGFLELAATDMERTVLAVSAAVYCPDADPNGFTAYVPARKLQAILKEVAEDDVTFEVKGNRATVTAGAGSWVLTLPDSNEYPELLNPGQLAWDTYPREKLHAALRAIRHAVCRDAGRPPLTQVDIRADRDQSDGGTVPGSATASDGTRFARAALEGFPQEMTVPASVLDDLMRLLASGRSDDIAVAVTEEALVFRVGPVVLAVARRSTAFPDMDRLLLAPAQENDQELTVLRDELATAVRQVRINADPDTSAIALLVSGDTLTVVSRDKAGNSASVPLHAGWQGDKDRVLCVNHVFLTELLAAHPDKACQFLLGKDHGQRRSAVLLQGNGMVQVIAQMAPKLVGY